MVTFARAALDPEMAADPLVTEVGLVVADGVPRRLTPSTVAAASGTVTRVASESFGAMSDRPASAEIEIRASWTPEDDALGEHLLAWGDLLCTAAGLPPLPAGVVPLPRR